MTYIIELQILYQKYHRLKLSILMKWKGYFLKNVKKNIWFVSWTSWMTSLVKINEINKIQIHTHMNIILFVLQFITFF